MKWTCQPFGWVSQNVRQNKNSVQLFPPRHRGRQMKSKRGSGGGKRESESALRSVICTDVAAALGQTLPVFCVHLRLVSPVLL